MAKCQNPPLCWQKSPFLLVESVCLLVKSTFFLAIPNVWSQVMLVKSQSLWLIPMLIPIVVGEIPQFSPWKCPLTSQGQHLPVALTSSSTSLGLTRSLGLSWSMRAHRHTQQPTAQPCALAPRAPGPCLEPFQRQAQELRTQLSTTK